MVNHRASGKNQLFFIVVGVALILFSGLRPVGIDNDSLNYLDALHSYSQGRVDIKEPSFILFSFIADAFFDGSIYFLFLTYSMLAISLKLYAIRKYSELSLLSLLVYVCMYYILHDMTQIRVGVAAAFFMLAIPDLIAGKRKAYLLKIGMAFLFHFSAVLLVPLVILNNKKLKTTRYFIMPFVAMLLAISIGYMNTILIHFFELLPAPLGPKAVNYIVNLQLYGRFDNVNVFSKITLCTLFFFTVYSISMSRVSKPVESDIIYFKIMSIMLTMFYFLSSVPVLASRSFELLGVSLIFSLPALSLRFRQKRFVGLVIVVWCLVYLYIVNLKLLNFEMLGTL